LWREGEVPRNEHAVDDVQDSIRCVEVCRHDSGVVDLDNRACDRHIDAVRGVECWDDLAVGKLVRVGRAGGDVVLQENSSEGDDCVYGTAAGILDAVLTVRALELVAALNPFPTKSTRLAPSDKNAAFFGPKTVKGPALDGKSSNGCV
jgi:hypothetical protein